MTQGAQRSVAGQVVIEVIAVIISLAVATGLSVLVVGLQINDARASAAQAQSEAQAGDLPGLIDSVEALRSNVAAVATYTKSPAWLITQYIPGVGQPVHAASTLTNGANNVAAASTGFLDLARQLEKARSTSGGQLVPTEVLTNLAPAANELAAALTAFTADIESLSVGAAYGPFQGKARAALQEAKDLLPRLTLLVKTLPSIAVLLGANSPQKWFVALQNGGESRGTGGLLGSFAVVDLDKGRAEPVQVGANELLTAKADPRLLPADSQALWGPARLAEVFGVNLSPNYPYAGELISSMWRNQTGSTPNAVLALDQRATALLIDAVGGVTVDGITLTGADATEFLTVGVYDKYPNSADKDAFVTKATAQLVRKIAGGGTSPIQLASKLANAVLERSVFLWAADASIQSSLAPSPIGGTVPDQPGPFSMAVINNNAANKMDTFLHTSINLQVGECVAGGRRSTMTVELLNSPPAKLPSYVDQRRDRRDLFGLNSAGDGSNRVRLALYLPSGAFLSSSAPKELYLGEERNHPVAMFGIELKRGERKTVRVEFTEFGDPTLLNQSPEVLEQPMLNPQQIVIQNGPKCA